jgi:periplasmic divalent cation tolerance protein
MKRMSDHVVVSSTVDSENSAVELARDVVSARLGACAQIVPITSVFQWNGDVQTEREWRIEIRTSAPTVRDLVERIRGNHPYDVPEIIVTPIVGGSEAYLDWLSAQTIPVG